MVISLKDLKINTIELILFVVALKAFIIRVKTTYREKIHFKPIYYNPPASIPKKF